MKWSDHILLNNLYRVFKKKILPNSTRQASSLFPDIIKDPSEWEESNEKSRSPDPRRRKKTMKESQPPESSQKSQTHFVSVISSDEEDNEVETTTDNRKNLVRTC